MNKALISIIIPVYNAEEHLERCLSSVINQSYSNLEIILINDGSIDNSLEICYKYSKIDCRINVINQTNLGVSESRNRGLLLANGDYIMFVDSDDYIEISMVEEMINALKNDNSDIVMCGFDRVYMNNNEILKIKNISYNSMVCNNSKEVYNYFYPFFDCNGFNSLWNKIYIKRIINDNNITFDKNINMGEDYLFNLEYIKHVNKCTILDKNLYKYVISKNILSNRYEINTLKNRLIISKETEKFLEKISFSKDSITTMNLRAVYSNFMMLHHKNCSLSFEEKIDFIKSILKMDVIAEIKNKTRLNSFYENILLYIIKLNSSFIIYIISNLMAITHNRIRKFT